MRLEVSALIRDAPESVWAWWTDYGTVGHRERVSHGLGTSMREVVAREGDTVVLREEFLGVGRIEHRIELHPHQRAFRETGKALEAWWRFEPVPLGTLVRREIELTGVFGPWAPPGLARWAFQRDLDHHAQEYAAAHLS